MQAYTMVFGMGLPVDPNSTTAFFVGYSMIHTVGEIFSNAAYLVGYPMEDHGKCYGMFNGHYKVHGLSQLMSNGRAIPFESTIGTSHRVPSNRPHRRPHDNIIYIFSGVTTHADGFVPWDVSHGGCIMAPPLGHTMAYRIGHAMGYYGISHGGKKDGVPHGTDENHGIMAPYGEVYGVPHGTPGGTLSHTHNPWHASWDTPSAIIFKEYPKVHHLAYHEVPGVAHQVPINPTNSCGARLLEAKTQRT